MKCLCLLLASLFLSTVLVAQELDAAFGDGGIATVAFTDTVPADLASSSLVVLEDGRLMTGGAGALLRFTDDGRADASFGDGGVVRFEGLGGLFASFDRDADGRLIATGSETRRMQPGHCSPDLFDNDFGVARFTAEGAPDHTFGTAGKVLVDFPRPLSFTTVAGVADPPAITAAARPPRAEACAAAADDSYTDDRISSAVLEPGGGLTAAGTTSTVFGPAYGALVRLLPTGTLDPLFGDGGRVVLPDAFPTLAALVRLDDGRYVGAGVRGDSAVLIRLTSTGRIDATFGQQGRSFVQAADVGTSVTVGALAVGPDGHLTVGGMAGDQPFFARVTAEGAPDTRFGSDARVLLPPASPEKGTSRVRALTVEADGSLWATGIYELRTLVVHLSPTGAVRLFISPQLTGRTEVPSDVTLLPDGRVALVGYTITPLGVFLALLQPDGTVDHVEMVGDTRIEQRDERLSALAVADDGALYIGTNRGSLLRLTPAGRVDASFPALTGEIASEPALDYGFLYTPTPEALIALGAYSGGVVRRVFDTDGNVLGSRELPLNPSGALNRPATFADGRLVVAGMVNKVSSPTGNDLALYSIAADGSADAGFGDAGLVARDVGSIFPARHYLNEHPDEVDGDAMGRTLVLGTFGDVFGLVRFLRDGTFDTSFGEGGFVPVHQDLRRLAVREDGSFIIAGRFLSGEALIVIRTHDADGSLLDSTTTAAPHAYFDVGRLLLLKDGTLLLGGHHRGDWSFMHFLASGELDSHFGVGGVYHVPLDAEYSNLKVLVETADGSVIAGGNAFGLSGPTNFLARVELAQATSTQEHDQPGSFWLGMPTPSPSQHQATVSFRVEAATSVDLGLFDVLGREVTKLRSGVVQAGSHSVEIDVSALAPGIYLLRLMVQGHVQSRPVVVI